MGVVVVVVGEGGCLTLLEINFKREKAKKATRGTGDLVWNCSKCQAVSVVAVVCIA